MKKLIFSVLLFFPFFINAQSDSKIDLVIGVDYSYRNLTNKDAAPLMDQFDGDTGKFNLLYGVNYNRRITDRIWLKTGLRKISLGFKGEKRDDIRWGSEHDGNGGWTGPDPSLYHESQFIYDYQFVEVPLLVRYELSEKKFTPFIEIGITPAFYVGTRVKHVTDVESHDSTTRNYDRSLNFLNVFANASFGFNYNLTDTWAIFSQPVFRYQLNALNDDPVKLHLLAVGLEAGLRVSFQ